MSDSPFIKRKKPVVSIQLPSAQSTSTEQADPEPMVIGTTPIDPTPPGGLSLPQLFSALCSASNSPIKRWHIRYSPNWHTVLGACTCFFSNGEEEFPAVLDPLPEVPDALRPVNIDYEVEDPHAFSYGPCSTHVDSLLIRHTQCFLVSSQKAFKACRDNDGLDIKLGRPVKFKEAICSTADCTVKCPECNVCPHVFICHCGKKYQDTQWCPHLHIMKNMTQGLFMMEGLLFIHEDFWKYTEKRHLRAFVQGETKMKKLDDGYWYEQFEYMRRSQPYTVFEVPEPGTWCSCPLDRRCELCDACLCKYRCSCEDNVAHQQVCEHMHNVAMQKSERRAELFKNLGEFGSQYHDSENPTEDPNLRYYIEQEHQMSFYFAANIITKQPGSKNEWHLKFTRPKEYLVKVEQCTDKDAKCICRTDEANKSNSCARCSICIWHYTCDCGFPQFVICRHIHAVVRKEFGIKEETPEQQFTYVQGILSRDLLRDANLRAKAIIREPIEAIRKKSSEVASEVAERSANAFSRFFQNLGRN